MAIMTSTYLILEVTLHPTQDSLCWVGQKQVWEVRSPVQRLPRE